MSAFALDIAPVTKYVLLVTFKWGATPTYTRYTTWDSDLVLSDGTFTSEILMEAETNGAQAGGVTDTPWNIRIPLTCDPATLVSRPYPAAQIYCRIEECNPIVPTERRTLFYGVASRGTQNKGGAKKLVQIEVAGIKQLLQFSSGIAADQQCAWALGDANCCVNLGLSSAGGLAQTVTISSLSGSVIGLSSISTPVGDSTYWSFGSITVDNLPIMIRSFAGLIFQMEELVPPEWNGSTGVIVPGCDKFSLTCQDRFNNLERFCGAGIAIPAYHPQLETSAK